MNTRPRILIILKPETIERLMIGEILSRFDKAKLVPIAMKQLTPTQADMMTHYNDCYEKYGPTVTDRIVKRMTRGPCIFIVYTPLASNRDSYVDNQDFIDAVRASLIGATDPNKSAKGTIRGDLATDINYNLVHGSDCVASATQEIDLWFPELI